MLICKCKKIHTNTCVPVMPNNIFKIKKLPCFLLTKKCIVSCDSKINWTLKSLMYMIQNIRCELERTLTKKSRVTPQGILSRTLKNRLGQL